MMSSENEQYRLINWHSVIAFWINCCYPTEFQQWKFVRTVWPSFSLTQQYHKFKYLLEIFFPHYNLVGQNSGVIFFPSQVKGYYPPKPNWFLPFRNLNLEQKDYNTKEVQWRSYPDWYETLVLGSYILLHKLWNYSGPSLFILKLILHSDWLWVTPQNFHLHKLTRATLYY